MINLFYYGTMGVVWLLAVSAFYALVGPWLFWPLLALVIVSGSIEGKKRARQNQPPRS